MSKVAFYITVDANLAGIAEVQARHLRSLWKLHVHLFLEDGGEPCLDEVGRDGIFRHRNVIRALLPKDLPKTRTWPEIIYARIFAPQFLVSYDRLIYLDADVFPIRADESLLTVELPGGLAAVQDVGTVGMARVEGGMTPQEWRLSFGMTHDRYFNSGVLVIDRARWVAIDMRRALVQFIAAHGSRLKTYDQDFLNVMFQGRWTELSPKFNFQHALYRHGYETIFPPVFLHFSSMKKPWLRPDHPRSLEGRFYHVYRKMLSESGFDPSRYARRRPEAWSVTARAAMRRALTGLGLSTRKEKRLRARWQKRRQEVFLHMAGDARSGRYLDQGFTLDHKPEVRMIFDGRELRPLLAIEIPSV